MEAKLRELGLIKAFNPSKSEGSLRHETSLEQSADIASRSNLNQVASQSFGKSALVKIEEDDGDKNAEAELTA